jgi:hypothetical protein
MIARQDLNFQRGHVKDGVEKQIIEMIVGNLNGVIEIACPQRIDGWRPGCFAWGESSPG